MTCMFATAILLCRPSQTCTHITGSAKKIKGKQQPATLSLHANLLSNNNDDIQFQFSGHKLVCANNTNKTKSLCPPKKHVHPCFAFRPIRTVCLVKATPSTPFQRGGKARLIGCLASPLVSRRVYSAIEASWTAYGRLVLLSLFLILIFGADGL